MNGGDGRLLSLQLSAILSPFPLPFPFFPVRLSTCRSAALCLCLNLSSMEMSVCFVSDRGEVRGVRLLIRQSLRPSLGGEAPTRRTKKKRLSPFLSLPARSDHQPPAPAIILALPRPAQHSIPDGAMPVRLLRRVRAKNGDGPLATAAATVTATGTTTAKYHCLCRYLTSFAHVQPNVARTGYDATPVLKGKDSCAKGSQLQPLHTTATATPFDRFMGSLVH
jgi:hypothetical protein